MGDLGFSPRVGMIPGVESLPTPVFWPEEFHGLYSPWGCKESDTTEQLSLSLTETRKMVAFYIEGKRWTIIVSIQQSNHIPIAKLKCCELIFKFEEK